jgi:Rrf2 family protein
MKLSTRTRYGIRALVDLGIHNNGQPIQLKDIAERQQISLPYLEHLITPLIAAGVIKSTRGARGGIKLAKAPQDIRLHQITVMLEGSLLPVDCLKDSHHCARAGRCAAQDLWADVGKAMERVLETTTLQDLVVRQLNKEGKPVPSMYYI